MFLLSNTQQWPLCLGILGCSGVKLQSDFLGLLGLNDVTSSDVAGAAVGGREDENEHQLR